MNLIRQGGATYGVSLQRPFTYHMNLIANLTPIIIT